MAANQMKVRRGQTNFQLPPERVKDLPTFSKKKIGILNHSLDFIQMQKMV
jgi:hypothetical protein